MEKVTCKLTVLFENPFWIGLFERKEGRNLSVAKVIFGAEPKEYDVYEFIQKNYYDLQFSPVVKVHTKKSARNPKRRQREARRQMEDVGIGTKSQQALKLQQEQRKQECKVKSREQKLAETKRMFELKQQKKKEKHRGR